ncbi:hypothetical protein [Carboxylicivirga taeanensis]|uniref:hypothetical protein n=1 Tax=Carboxylicivirga taeanensis TaxID=1416875 RepID=UPI003F6DC425
MNKENKHSAEETDKMIKNLFNDFSLEEAPESIKTETMNRVFSDWTENAIDYQPIINKNNRWWIIGGFAALLAISFLFDASVIINYWNQISSNNSFIDFSQLSGNLGTISTAMQKMPSIVYFTAAGIIILIGIDRFFNRLANI